MRRDAGISQVPMRLILPLTYAQTATRMGHPPNVVWRDARATRDSGPSLNGGTMSPEQYEAMQLERFRRAAARELEHERATAALKRKVAVLCVLAALVVLGILAGLAASLWPSTASETDAPEMAGSGVVDETWATDGGAGVIAKPMPPEPLKGQKRPPCSADETAIAGGCWVELARSPEPDMCGSRYEHGGRCYLPVQQAKRPPTSVEP